MKNETKNFQSLKQMLKNTYENKPKEVAFELPDGEIVTYKRFYKQVCAVGSALLGKYNLNGEKIAVSGVNSYEWLCTYFAVTGGVGVITPIDKELPFEEMRNLIEFAEIKAIVADKSVTKKLLKNIGLLPKDFIIITTDETQKSNKVIAFEQVVLDGKQLILNGYKDYELCQIDSKALAVILFTSGTTGMSKGVMLSNENVCSDIIATSQAVHLTSEDSVLSFLPIHHAYECITLLMCVSAGAKINFSGGLRHITNDFKRYKPTIFVSVPLLIEKMYERMQKKMVEDKKDKLVNLALKTSPVLNTKMKKQIFKQIHDVFGGNIRLIIAGAASLNPQVAKQFFSFGIPVLIGYGLTECSPIVISNSDNNITFDSIGKPLQGVLAKIINPDENNIGEICVKGDMVMMGYFKNVQETEKVLKKGWFHTGDLGFKDSKGNYHITGRSKNVIVTKNGKNIYPEELEYYLNSEPLILESIVFSKQDSEESVIAKVVADMDAVKEYLKKEAPTAEEIQKTIQEVVRKINKKLPSYKSIKNVEIKTEAFKKTTTNKIKRYEEVNDEKNKD